MVRTNLLLLLALGVGASAANVLVPSPRSSVFDEAEKLLQQYAETVEQALSLANENLEHLQDKIVEISNLVFGWHTRDLDIIRDEIIKQLTDYEDANRENGVDVTPCTQFGIQRITSLTEATLEPMTECHQYRVDEYDSLVVDVFANVAATAQPVEYYRAQIEDCQAAERVEECVIRIMVTLSSRIEFIPELVTADVREIYWALDDMSPSYRVCFDTQAEHLNLSGSLIYDETLNCVHDMH